jgi:fibronectin type 3 domain-containing protein
MTTTTTASGLINWASTAIVTWPPATTTDTTAPTQPTGLTATAASSSQVNLSWTASTDNVGVTGYRIYRSSTAGTSPVLVNTITTTSYGDSGLTANTGYTYYVVAIDAANNQSAHSNTATATTKAVAATTTIQGQVTSTLSPHNPIANAHVYTDSKATVSGTVESVYTDAQGNYTLTNIIPNTSHSYYVSATGYHSRSYYGSLLPGLNIENLSLTPTSR